MCAETPLSAGVAMHSAAGVRVEHGARHIIRFPVTGFLWGRLLPGSCRWFSIAGFRRRVSCCWFPAVVFCRISSRWFPALVSRRRVFVVERLLPGSCLSAFVAGFPVAGFLSLSVCCPVPAAGFPAAGFPPCILSQPGLRRVGPDGTMLSGSYCDPGESRRSSPAPSLSTIRDGA